MLSDALSTTRTDSERDITVLCCSKLMENDVSIPLDESNWRLEKSHFFLNQTLFKEDWESFCLFLISWVNSRSLHNIKKIVYKENIKLWSRLLSIFYHINKNEFIALRMKNNVRLPLFRVNFIKWASPFFSFMIRTRQNAHHVHYYTFLLFLNRYHRKCNWIIA